MRRLILGMVSMCAALSTAMAGPLEDTEAAYSRGDRVTALRLLRTLADQDVNGAQSLLGKIFPPCKVEIPDYSEIVALFREGAARGNPRAQFNLGNAYFFGSGVPKDHVEAVKWYRLAADQGEAGALHNLGFMYQTGKGVPQDNVRAHMWLSLFMSRASTESKDAALNKDAATRSLGIVAVTMTPAELAEARGLARAWTPARHGDE
jgi:uncharacterized protein